MPQQFQRGKPLFATARSNATGLRGRLRTIEARRRTVLFSAGDRPSGIYVVVTGVVKLCLPSTPRGEKVIALLGPGESFGMSAVLSGKPHIVTAVAARDCTLLHLPHSSAVSEMRRNPKFARQVAVELNRRFRNLIADIQMTTRQSAIQRTVAFLLGEMGSENGSEPVAMRLPAKKGDIASKLDLTGAHFSRILHELHSSGIVKLQGSTVTVQRVAQLRKFAAVTRNGKRARGR